VSIENLNNILMENGLSEKQISEIWGITLQATRAKLKGAQSISLDEALTLGDYIYEELNEWSRFLRMLRELNKSSKKVKVMLISACEKQGVNYKDLANILNLTNIQFSQRVTMKVKFSTAEALLLAETLYQDESERYHFIKKLMEISQ